MTPPLGALCATCRRQFTDNGWVNRHNISNSETIYQNLEASNHHDGCCMICIRNGKEIQ